VLLTKGKKAAHVKAGGKTGRANAPEKPDHKKLARRMLNEKGSQTPPPPLLNLAAILLSLQGAPGAPSF